MAPHPTRVEKGITMNYMESFTQDRNKLIKQNSDWKKVAYLEEEKCIFIPTPEILAGFAGYLIYHNSKRVLYRGERDYHPTTIPALFRKNSGKIDKDEIQNRKQALNKLVGKITLSLKDKNYRFNCGYTPLLQHYGIKTDWIDVVDNIFVALWFSNYNLSTGEFSYLKFFNCEGLYIRNCRRSSSLSLRPHCQHAYSITKQGEWNVNTIDFTDNLIATVKIPVCKKTKLKNDIFSCKYFFPDKEIDNTLKILLQGSVQKIIDEITKDYQLSEGDLGKIQTREYYEK